MMLIGMNASNIFRIFALFADLLPQVAAATLQKYATIYASCEISFALSGKKFSQSTIYNLQSAIKEALCIF